MASQIIPFILDRWEDTAIALIVGLALLLIDKFVLRKMYPESEKSNTLVATDRIITYLIIMSIIVFYLLWSKSPEGDYMWVWAYFGIMFFLLIIFYMLIGQREKCIKAPNPPDEATQPQKKVAQPCK
jgi:O-antigen/teichoic acid export membrane protein